MYRNTFYLKAVWKKYNKVLVAAGLGLMLLAWPAYHVSRYFLIDDIFNIPVAPSEQIDSTDELKIKVYDNFKDLENVDFKQIILDKINNSKEDIVIAMYSFNMEEVKQALVAAAKRGVKIRIAYEYSNSADFDAFIKDAADFVEVKYIGVKNDGSHYHLHHKYAIFDHKELVTGSWNWSYFQQNLDPNVLLEVSNREIVDSFYSEFNRIWSGNYGRRKFFDWAYVPWMETVKFAGSSVEVWFSPGKLRHSVQDRIIQLIKNAQREINIAMTIMDSRNIANELLAKASEGVQVNLIVDIKTAGNFDSQYRFLKDRIESGNLGVNFHIYLGGTMPTETGTAEITGQEAINNQAIPSPETSQSLAADILGIPPDVPDFYSIFHHHNMIVDGKVVVTGTANWTYGGFFLNDENFLVISDSGIAADFNRIFEAYLKSLPEAK